MTSGTLESRDKTSVQAVDFEFFISVQVHTTPLSAPVSSRALTVLPFTCMGKTVPVS